MWGGLAWGAAQNSMMSHISGGAHGAQPIRLSSPRAWEADVHWWREDKRDMAGTGGWVKGARMGHEMGIETGTVLTGLSARTLAARIAVGELAAVEVVEAHIQRIEAVNARLNAVVVTRYEEARAEARAADERRARGEPLGPLHGVPITIKESLDLAARPPPLAFPRASGRSPPVMIRMSRGCGRRGPSCWARQTCRNCSFISRVIPRLWPHE